MSTKKEKKIREKLDEGRPLYMRIKRYDSLGDEWRKRFHLPQFEGYHKTLKKLENKVVKIKTVLSNGAILIEESSIAFGSDVIEFIEDSFLDDDMFEI